MPLYIKLNKIFIASDVTEFFHCCNIKILNISVIKYIILAVSKISSDKRTGKYFILFTSKYF